jgi:hypothetical protein
MAHLHRSASSQTTEDLVQLAAPTIFKGEIQFSLLNLASIIRVFFSNKWNKDNNRRDNFNNNNRESQQPFEPFESLSTTYNSNNNNNRFVPDPATFFTQFTENSF